MRIIQQKGSADKASASFDQGSRKGAFELSDNRPIATQQRSLQRLADESLEKQYPLQRTENKTGLPDQLKSGIEGLSGFSLDPVKVHYNSAKPATVQAHAYARGTDIHLGPGQEKHLPHEAWHVVQQMQGRVKPTTAVNGQAVNDNGGLEREADVMGNKALQLRSAAGASPALGSAINSGAMQRKINPDLEAIPATAPFAHGGWAAARSLVDTYKLIPLADKVYVEQKRQLLAIQALVTPLYTSGIDANDVDRKRKEQTKRELLGEKLQLVAQKNELQQAATLATVEISRIKQAQLLEKLQESLKAMDSETDSSPKQEEVAKPPEQAEELRILEMKLAEKEAATIDQEEAIRLVDVRIDTLGRELTALDNFDVQLNDHQQRLSDQLNGVKGQMNSNATAKEAEFVAIKNTTNKRWLIQNRPAEINTLAAKFKAATDDNTRFTIALKMQDRIDSWKTDYVENGQIKASITGSQRTDREEKYESIKLVEEQLGYTLRELSKSLFAANGFGAAGEGASNLKTAFDTGGSVLQGGVTETKMAKGVISELTKGDDQQAERAKFQTALTGMEGAADGADALIQVQKLINIGLEFKEKGGRDRFLSSLEALDTLGTGIADTAKLANLIGGGELEGAEPTALWSEGLAQAIGGLRSAVLGVISLIKALKKKGVDVEHARTDAMTGGVSLLKATASAAKAAKTFFTIADKTVPPALLSTIPALGIAVNAASAALSVYQGYQGRKKEKGMEEDMDTFLHHGARNTVASLAPVISMNDVDLGKITHLESRGVFGQVGGKKYLRFNAYVMAKIDNHDWSSGSLTIVIGGGNGNVLISKGQARLIREYEYLSKMMEINQKRKIKGGSDAVLSLVNMGGDIANLTGFGALVGTPMKAATAGAQITHAVAKGGERIIRNRQRATLEARTGQGDIAAIADQATYDASYPTDWGRSKVDKSSKQKETEYRRHAAYVLERLSLLPEPTSDTDFSNVSSDLRGIKKLISATGVDYYDFLNAADLPARFKLLVSAQKTGR